MRETYVYLFPPNIKPTRLANQPPRKLVLPSPLLPFSPSPPLLLFYPLLLLSSSPLLLFSPSPLLSPLTTHHSLFLDTSPPPKVYLEVRRLPPDLLFLSRPSGLALPPRQPRARQPHQATLAQLVEHSIRNRKVIGSSPMGGSIRSTTYRHERTHEASDSHLETIITVIQRSERI